MNEYIVFDNYDLAYNTLYSLWKSGKDFAMDIETTGLNEYSNSVLGVGFSWEPHTGIYLPWNVRDLGLWANDLEPRWDIQQMNNFEELFFRLLTSNDRYVACHNADFELRWFKKHFNIEIAKTFDTQWYRFVANPDTSKGYEHRLSLGYIADEKYEDLRGLKDIWKGIKSKKNEEDRDLSLYKTTQEIGEYCCKDCDATYREFIADSSHIKGQPYENVFYRRLCPAVHFISNIRKKGILVDKDYLLDTKRKLEVIRDSSLLEIQSIVGNKRFNPSSELDLKNLFFHHYKLPDLNNGHLDEPVLKEYYLRYDNEIADKILSYRKTCKLISTYFDNILANINPITGRIHGDFLLWGTETGRLSCRNPNLQNLPSRDETGSSSDIVKRMFIASEGKVLIGADYSQIELRLLAWFSQDKMLLKAYNEGIDVHSLTASILFGIPVEKVEKKSFERHVGKTSNFAWCYKGGAGVVVFSKNGLGNRIMGPEYAKKLGISYDDIDKVKIDRNLLLDKARYYHDLYFSPGRGYEGIPYYWDRVISEVKKLGYARTAYGRIRYIDGLNSSDGGIRSHAEKQAVNTGPQGTASDYLLFHSMDMEKEFKKMGYGVDFLMLVHDQNVQEVDEDDAEKVCKLIPDLGVRMDEANIGIPMKLEPIIGKHLGEV